MKGFSLFLSILAVLAAGASAAFFILVGNKKAGLENELATARADIARSQQRSADLIGDKDTLTRQAAALEAETIRLRERNTALEARNATLSKEMSQIRDQLGLREHSEQGVSNPVNELRRQLEEARNAAAVSAGGATSDQVAAYEARIADLEAQVAVLRAGASPPSAEQLARVPVDLSGNVIEVGPQGAFVVLNIGSRQGALPSLEMVLRRGGTIVAHVRLTDVRESYSVAHVLPKSGSGSIRAGDTASRS